MRILSPIITDVRISRARGAIIISVFFSGLHTIRLHTLLVRN